MPLPSYKAVLGVALDLVKGQLAAPITSASTSMTLVNTKGTTGTLTTAGANYTALVFDGYTFETVACSGNLNASTGVISTASPVNSHSEWIRVSFVLTSLLNSGSWPTLMPVEDFKPSDTYEALFDTAHRGWMAEQVGAELGVRTGDVEFSGAVFPITFGYVLGAMFGSVDTAGPSPAYNYAFATTNVGDGQPDDILLFSYDAYNTRVTSGRLTDLTITADPGQLIKYTAKALCRASGVISGLDNTKFSTPDVNPIQAWTGKATIGGSDVGKTLTFDVTFARSQSEAIKSLSGTPDPWTIWVGALTAAGKFALVFDDDTQQNNYIQGSGPIVDFKWTRGTGVSTVGLEVHMQECWYTKALVVPFGKSYVTNEVDYTTIANSTDATTSGTGGSVAKVTLTNGTSGTVYV